MYQIKPLRRRGQNFLINPLIIDKILETADLKKDDTVLEIGSGLGTLTREIAKKVKMVVAVEVDQILVQVLKDQLREYQNIEIIQGDIRKLSLKDLKLSDYQIVTNLPFNITGLVLKRFLSEKPKPRLITLILQKEVAERIIAQPSQMSILAVAVQFYAQAKIISSVSRNNFWPKPKVDSVIMKIIPLEGPTFLGNQISEEQFFKIVKAGFSSRRKYVLNNLAKGAIMDKALGGKIFKKLGFNPKVRAQELSVEDWIKLTKELK
ncbi:ribosomal RNA small subunit methyltransferase A [Patescibacteria group bacterium]|nr:ribosomal RNA small subunit methyltransferase A [Patescibacteria group bacterium]